MAGLFGLCGKASPYVTLSLGSEKRSTACIKSAGNSMVVFDEALSLNKNLLDAALRVHVYDKGLVSDSLLGECTVNLHRLNMGEDFESDAAQVSFAAS